MIKGVQLYLTDSEFREIIQKSREADIASMRECGLSEEHIKLSTKYLNINAGGRYWEGRELIDFSPYFIVPKILDEAIQKYGDRKE